MIELNFFLERKPRINADFFPHHTIRCTAICISSNKGKTTIAVLIQFCQSFPLFRFPLHSPLPKPLFFSLFSLVELLLCIIDSKLLQIFSGSHSIHMKALPVMLVHLFGDFWYRDLSFVIFLMTLFAGRLFLWSSI